MKNKQPPAGRLFFELQRTSPRRLFAVQKTDETIYNENIEIPLKIQIFLAIYVSL
ncbi:MAG: hypothetical protein IJY96_08720 [Oscillospiraceae bacterium]|nr:hypothetical protein [Oscillospiraceae bacterium]